MTLGVISNLDGFSHVRSQRMTQAPDSAVLGMSYGKGRTEGQLHQDALVIHRLNGMQLLQGNRQDRRRNIHR